MTERFMDRLHADPSVATCSVLASQIAANADRLLSQPEPGNAVSSEYTVANEIGTVEMQASKIRIIGKTALSGLDLRLAEFMTDAERPAKGLYSLVRGNILLEIATFSANTVGPCNYVQFPGEISEGMVLTPYDEENRKPLLQEMLALGGEYKKIDLHANSTEGLGYDLDPYASDRLRCIYEYALCPEVNLKEAGKKLLKVIGEDIAFNEEEELVAAAYATQFGRFENGPLIHMLNRSDYSYTRQYDDVLDSIKKDPHASPESSYIKGLKIGEYYRSLHHQGIPQYQLSVPLLEKLTKDQFKKVFGLDYDPTHEQVLKDVFNVAQGVVKKIVKNGYESHDKSVTADVEYTLNINPGDDKSKRSLELSAQITTMPDIEPTICGLFKADQFGSLLAIASNGQTSALSSSQIEELNDILTGEMISHSPLPLSSAKQAKRKKSVLKRFRAYLNNTDE